MSERVVVYVDGESHYIRSLAAWRDLRGDKATLEDLRYVGQPDDRLTLVIPEAKVFWTRKLNPGVQRVVYFTSATCNDEAHHKFLLQLREFDVDGCILKETRDLASRRENRGQQTGLIEKPKGVDIALATQMVEEACTERFDTCHLYTSDADFVPAIEAVRRRSKRVVVHGYTSGLGKLSRLLTVPDVFEDLRIMMKDQCELRPGAVGQ